jgi:hypothetical protein
MDNTAVILNEYIVCNEPFDYTEWQRKHYENFSVAELNKSAVEYANG